jgi:pantothenate kinase-related protein Tda10
MEWMQNRSPALLSTTTYNGDAYIIQEMQPTKDSINFKLIKNEYRNIFQVIDDMAMLTASAQLRSSDRQGSATTDELIAFGKDDFWQASIIDHSLKYSRMMETYYREFTDLYK